MREVYIVSFARTPIGNLGGSLSAFSATQLGSIAIKAAVAKAGITPEMVQEVIMGNVLTANVGQAPARQAVLGAGLPVSTVCTTINKVCASGMKAIMLGAQSIMLGDNDIMVCGGMESMTNAPHYLPAMRGGIRYGAGQVIDGIVRDGLQDPYDQSMMGNCGEVCARERNISREAQDEFAMESYRRAREAAANGSFKTEITPVEVQGKNGVTYIETDEEVGNSRIVDISSLQKMRPAFDKAGTITAANASKINDGAAAVVLMSKEKADALGIKPLARIVAFADAAQEPVWFTTTPAIAMQKALTKANLSLSQMDAIEVNEAFAVVALANAAEMKMDLKKVNQWGGAVAIGHPIGVSGCRIVGTLTSILAQNGGKYGIASICNGGGGASALIIEKI